MSSDTILLIIIIIYLLFLHNKKKIYIEKFSSINDIRLAVKEIYINDMNNLKKSLDLIKKLNNNNNLYISGNLNVNGIINGKKNIITLNNDGTVKAGINNIYTDIDNILTKPFTKYWGESKETIINGINSSLDHLIKLYNPNDGSIYKDLDEYIDNNSLVYLTHGSIGEKRLGLNSNNDIIMSNDDHHCKISQSKD